MKTKTKVKAAPKPANKPTLVCLLLDRSGSMGSCKNEVIGGFNAYVDGLKDEKNMRFTLTQFDSGGIDVLHNAVLVASVKKLTEATYQPRGNTPLYDAMGKTIRAAQAKAGDKYKVLFVTQTDGQENASSEWNHQSIRELIKSMEDGQHWTFVYLGMGPEGWSQMQAISHGTQSVGNNMKFTGATAKQAFASNIRATRKYARGGQGVCSVSASFYGDAGVDKDQTK